MRIRTKTPVVPGKTLAVQLKEADQLAELDQKRRAAGFAREQEERERDAERRTWAEEDQVAKVTTSTERYRKVANRLVPYLPLVVVNLAALIGQFSWAIKNLHVAPTVTGGWGNLINIITAVIYAIAAESIALFLQYYANKALQRRDSANGLYLAAFVVAGVVASINYSHYHVPNSETWDLTKNATAIVFAVCSLASPWLWRIHSRATNRETLKLNGEIDTRAVRLSMARKIFHPVKSFQVIRMAAWTGTDTPSQAVEEWEAARASRKVIKDQVREQKAAPAPAAPVVVTPAPATAPRTRAALPVSSNGTKDWTKHAKWSEGLATFTASYDAGMAMTVAALAASIGQKNKVLASEIIKHVKNERGV